MVNIFFDNTEFTLLLDGTNIATPPFSIDEGTNHTILLIPALKKFMLMPLCSSLKVSGKTIFCSELISVFKLSNNDYLILPEFATALIAPQVIKQENYVAHLATFYNNGNNCLLIENSTEFYFQTLPYNDCEIKYQNFNGYEFFIVTNNNYLLIICYDYDYRKVLEAENCSRIEFTEDGILIEEKRNDMLLRNITNKYSFDSLNYNIISTNVEYLLPHQYIDEMIPCLFVEGLIAKDFSYASGLLSSDFNDINSVCDFFGEIIKIYDLPCLPYIQNSLYIITKTNGKNILNRYNFSIKNRKITDISCE